MQMRVVLRECRKPGLYPFGITLAILISGLVGCSSLCQDTVVSKHSSPDGRFVAVVFYRNCGATTPFTTEISVMRSGEDAVSEGPEGNILSMTDPPGSKETLSRNGVIEARVTWKSPQLLAISTPRRAVVGKRVSHVGDIKVEFSDFD